MKQDFNYLLGNQHAKGAKPNSTAFKKGCIPWNKNKKGIHLSEATEFKKGRKSPKCMPVGSIRKRRSKKSGQKRNFIKVSEPMQWEELAKYIWKQKYGVILKGDVIHHKNGNMLDDRLENLIALPRADHPIFHSRWGLRQFSEEQIAYYIGRYDG